ncbi:MAG: DUF433 domain-containing protein [Chitinophagaceae bacterium]|nr:DUF433 domain-containing protein [Chitinophagaceae bacterium]
MNWKRYIEFNPKILFGKAVIKGTRIPVFLILEKLGAGHNTDAILKAYPRIDLRAIQACLYFASENSRFI